MKRTDHRKTSERTEAMDAEQEREKKSETGEA